MKTRLTHFLALFVFVFCFAAVPSKADTLIVPEPKQVRESIRAYVDDSRMVPGIVVGLTHQGERSIHSYCDSGRDEVPLDQGTLTRIQRPRFVSFGAPKASATERSDRAANPVTA
jgi:hypothetical protein